MENKFDIPVAVFMFKRANKTAAIIDQIAKVKPQRLYLIGDGARNEEEKDAVEQCRLEVERHITWKCEVIKNYADVNRGVYNNIAGGALWVFERESVAIFLEDDNMPALSFFRYCKEMLERYKDDNRILWVCGTNYMQHTDFEDGSDYCFTKMMLPCGWASWASKFPIYYDGLLDLYRLEYIKKSIKMQYSNKTLYRQDKPKWDKIIWNLDHGINPGSWDYQMAFALRVHSMYGIAPKNNLITNIGVDAESIHGGTNMSLEMTKRFCEVPSLELEFPLKHPRVVKIDPTFEKRTEEIVIYPFGQRIKIAIVDMIRVLLHLGPNESVRSLLVKKK